MSAPQIVEEQEIDLDDQDIEDLFYSLCEEEQARLFEKYAAQVEHIQTLMTTKEGS